MMLNILQCACGFLFQILPGAFFCLYPFRNNFRCPLKGVLAGLGVTLTAMTVLFTYVYIKLEVPAAGNISHSPLEVIFLVTLLFLLLFYIFFVKAQTSHKLFVLFIIMTYGFLVTEAVSYLLNLFPVSYDEYMYSSRTLIFHLSVNGILFCPMLDLMRYIQKALGSHISDRMWRSLTIIPAAFVLALLIFYELPVAVSLSAESILGLLSKAMIIFILFLYYWLFRILEQVRTLSEEQAYLSAMAGNQRSQAESEKKVREARHEIMHHINALSILIKAGDYAGAENYLDKISMVSYEMPVPKHTSHPLLNAILAEYKKQAENAQVKTTYQILAQTFLSIEDSDLCQLVSNLLDNALEGCSHVAPEKRSLQLIVRQKGNFLFFSCENSCNPAKIKYKNQKLVSTKTGFNRKAHGFGISIMEQIAEKYNGFLRTSAEGNTFTVNINLCLNSDKVNEREG